PRRGDPDGGSAALRDAVGGQARGGRSGRAAQGPPFRPAPHPPATEVRRGGAALDAGGGAVGPWRQWEFENTAIGGTTEVMSVEEPRAPKAPAKARALRPRDAATLIIVDQSSGEPRVLLGRRRHDMAFMPGRYVFPGGRVDPADRQIPVADHLASGDLKKPMVAMKGTASEARARSLALAAVRETFEEAGLIIGAPLTAPIASKAEGWQAFLAHGFLPSLSRLRFFARAITPPGRPRRFDSRFFCVPAEAIVHKVAAV